MVTKMSEKIYYDFREQVGYESFNNASLYERVDVHF